MGPLSVNGSHPGPTSRKLIRLQRGDVVGSINIKAHVLLVPSFATLASQVKDLKRLWLIVRQNFAILASQERERVESVMVAWKSVINH
jgi:hypothetical protein